MKTTILSLMILTSLSSFAGATRSLASDNQRALEACEAIPFSGEKERCIDAVSSVAYFDDDAVSLCSSIPFSGKKIECLQAISNKQFSAGKVKACQSPFSDKIIQCLAGSVPPRPQPIPVPVKNEDYVTLVNDQGVIMHGSVVKMTLGNTHKVGGCMDSAINDDFVGMISDERAKNDFLAMNEKETQRDPMNGEDSRYNFYRKTQRGPGFVKYCESIIAIPSYFNWGHPVCTAPKYRCSIRVGM